MLFQSFVLLIKKVRAILLRIPILNLLDLLKDVILPMLARCLPMILLFAILVYFALVGMV